MHTYIRNMDMEKNIYIYNHNIIKYRIYIYYTEKNEWLLKYKTAEA